VFIQRNWIWTSWTRLISSQPPQIWNYCKETQFLKGKTNSSGKSFLNRNYYFLSTRPLLKLSWKKQELEKRTWSEAMKTSREKWSKKQKRQTRWWNRWWKCSRNKPNLSCTPLPCLFSMFVLMHVYASELFFLCFWTYFKLLTRSCVTKLISFYRISHCFSHIFLLVFILYFLLMTKGGADV